MYSRRDHINVGRIPMTHASLYACTWVFRYEFCIIVKMVEDMYTYTVCTVCTCVRVCVCVCVYACVCMCMWGVRVHVCMHVRM